MGIFGLESYVEKNCRDAFYEVDIRLLIEKAKNRRPDVPPTLVVDLLACERSFYGNLVRFTSKVALFSICKMV
jgi:hypothetical protein